MNVSKEDIKKIANNIKYPHNVEWSSKNDKVIDKVIAIWKKASREQKEDWDNSRHEFYDKVDPGFSDDGWDYFNPQYIYFYEDELSNIPARYLSSEVKQTIIKYHFQNRDLTNTLFDFALKIQDIWNYLSEKMTLKEKFENGFVSKEFANAMRKYKNDPEAWEAMEAFYESGQIAF